MKFIKILLCLLVAFSVLAGCKRGQGSTVTATPAGTVSPKETADAKNVKVTIVNGEKESTLSAKIPVTVTLLGDWEKDGDDEEDEGAFSATEKNGGSFFVVYLQNDAFKNITGSMLAESYMNDAEMEFENIKKLEYVKKINNFEVSQYIADKKETKEKYIVTAFIKESEAVVANIYFDEGVINSEEAEKAAANLIKKIEISK